MQLSNVELTNPHHDPNDQETTPLRLNFIATVKLRFALQLDGGGGGAAYQGRW
jgi:hypothetical protein